MMAAEKLRDLSQPIDVGVLDATVAAFYGTGSKDERTAADHILRELQNNPDMWLQVVHILSNTSNLNTKFFALQVLEGVIKYRWNVLPVEQRDGMKNYISDVIVKLSSNEASFRQERLYVNKLNIILVQILKHEWPAKWTSFIPDLVTAAKTSETICENCMVILKLLSEEVFDFSRGEMTQQKIKELKQSLNSEFQLIHELCLYVLSASQRTELICATLATLHAFLSWIPLGYIFESTLLETLLKFFPVPSYRNLTLQCLTEVAALNFGDFYNGQYVNMYNIFIVQLQTILPINTNIPNAYANGNSEEQAFIQNLAMFFTAFFKVHIRVLEATQENINSLLIGLEYLINISYVDDTEVFKVCLDYWNALVLELYEANHNLDSPAATANMMGLQMPLIPGMVDGLGGQKSQRRQLYAGPMSKLRLLMISRMAKPEEVLIVEDENGNIVRETLKDNDVLVQYKSMRETLIYLSHLDHDDTEKQMLKKLSKQLNGEDWNWNNLNTLCWAIGSISGSMLEEQENRFLVMVIRDLLNLCEITKGKDNKAVIASNIMYVVGQYPRFLRAHWKFLKTVVNKLFEFMHEVHPGVQDMACDTFLKIVQKCKRKFVLVQIGENEPFVSELLTMLPTTIAYLEPHQIHSFYESSSDGSYRPPQISPYAQRKTKIVCTIGSSTSSREMIWKLAETGMNVARLNMSHGDHASHQKTIDLVKEYNDQFEEKVISIMLDTKGPEVRSGDVPKPIFLEEGQEFNFTIKRGVSTNDTVSVNYDDFINDVAPGDILLVDGGMMSLAVKSKTKDIVKCEVVDGGELKSRRHLNVRGKSATLPSITDKDWEDIKFGVDNEVDFYAVSFVKNAEVVHELKQYLKSCNADIHVIVKIESADSIVNLPSILAASDGAMVARGDLGAELPIEEVPLLQEEIIRRCQNLQKPVIVATNMLESMIDHPTPTRAEVSDIAIAVKQGADAIMLSGETAHGKFPLKAVKVMHTVALRTESSSIDTIPPVRKSAYKSHMGEIFGYHAATIANTLATPIIVFTRTGSMAIILSHYRPCSTIFAFTNEKRVKQRLGLYHGVMPIYMEFSDDAEETFSRALKILLDKNLVKEGQYVTLVQSGAQPIWRQESTHHIQVRMVQG